MANFQIKYLTAAWRDVEQIADYLLQKVGATSAQQVTDRILDAIDLLADYPLMAPLHSDPELAALGYRKLVIDQTYVAVYRVDGQTVYIYRVVNGATDYPKLLL